MAEASDQGGSCRKRILFVDDDPALLHSLQCVLRRDRARWDMVFALGGSSALAHLRDTTFDAVVSDMRMPDVDGATLLTAVRDQSPSTARILLTGYAGDDDLRRIFPALHQVLSKPCSVVTLRRAIEDSVAGCGGPGGK